MTPDLRRLTTRHGTIAAVLSFLAQPIPGADELIVIPIHYAYARKFGKLRGVGLLKLPWRPVTKIIWGGAAVRLVANFTLGLIPVAGAFSNAATALALTEYLGHYLDAALDDPDAPPPEVSLADLKKRIEDVVKRGAKKKSDGEVTNA